MSRRYLTPPEFAALTGVPESTVRDWCRGGKLRAHKRNGHGHWRIVASEAGRVAAASPARDTAPDTASCSTLIPV